MDKLIRCKELYLKLFRCSDTGRAGKALSESEVSEVDYELYQLTNEISDEEYRKLRVWLDKQCQVNQIRRNK